MYIYIHNMVFICIYIDIPVYIHVCNYQTSPYISPIYPIHIGHYYSGSPAFFQVMMKSFASPTKHCCLVDWMGVAISTRFFFFMRQVFVLRIFYIHDYCRKYMYIYLYIYICFFKTAVMFRIPQMIRSKECLNIWQVQVIPRPRTLLFRFIDGIL